jgi:hypothetical protein
MRNRFRWCGLVTLLLLLGCASEPGAAQDQGKGAKEEEAPKGKEEGKKAPAKAERKKAKAKSKKKKMDPHVYRATIVDRFQPKDPKKQKPFKATKIRLFEPEVSLFGGSAGKESKTLLLLFRGAATIEVPFARLKKIEVKDVKEDRLNITVEIDAKEKADQKLEGTVIATLELRGLFAKDFKTTIKLRDVKTLVLELDPESPQNKKLKAGEK